MSASPAGEPPSGPAATTPTGTAATMQRKRPHTNPFMAKKKAVKKAPAVAATNGANEAAKTASKPGLPTVSKPVAEEVDPDDDPSTYTAYPLVASKKALLQGFRYHAMRLASQHPANPYDESQFTRPLRLHRRFARDQKIDENTLENGVDDKEREKEEIRKAERQAQKEANQAQIAPTEKSAQQKKAPPFKKKVEDVFFPQDTPEAQKRAKLRYEEGRPWHLEDFDSKNTWIGSYEEPMSETHAMLALDANGSFRMVPLEKWYRFIQTNRFKTMNLDEAEKHMAKKVKDGRWFTDKNMSEEQRQRVEFERQRLLQRGRVGMRGERSGGRRDDDDEERPEEVHDADEIDYNAEDEFQDDDEGGLFLGEEEDVKESERKIRQEMLGANIFAGTGVKEERDWDAEEEKEKRKLHAERKRQRKLRRTLVKNERKYEYDDSESDNPYSDSSDTTSEDELTKDEIKKEDDKASLALNGDKLASGASSIGTNTPSGRGEKHGDLRANHLGANLKRPGSPNLSEASGSESSRKRIKKEAGAISRPMSPSVGGAKGLLSPSVISRRRGAGSGSDTEASGTERGSVRSKIRLNPASRDASPATSVPGSRAVSPPRSAGPATPTASGAAANLPSAEEVKAAIPPHGISIQELIKRFRARIPKTANVEFIALVKKVGKNAPGDKTLIVPK